MLVLEIAAGIILAVVVLIAVPVIIWQIVDRWRFYRYEWPRNKHEPAPPAQPYQTAAEWRKANPSR